MKPNFDHNGIVVKNMEKTLEFLSKHKSANLSRPLF